jgi:hypothetical protein
MSITGIATQALSMMANRPGQRLDRIEDKIATAQANGRIDADFALQLTQQIDGLREQAAAARADGEVTREERAALHDGMHALRESIRAYRQDGMAATESDAGATVDAVA